jgi:Tol biopolymer transport system component
VAAALHQYASEQNLVILDSSVLPYPDHCQLGASTARGVWAGKVVIPKDKQPYQVGVSPDGKWLAWCNKSARPWPEGTGEPLHIFIANSPQSVRTLNPKASSGEGVAISSRAEHIALTVFGLVGKGNGPRLVVLNAVTGEVERDLTDVLPGSTLHSSPRLGISGSGNRLVVPLEQILVIDVPSHKVVVQEHGDYPALSPDGESLALIDDRHRIVVVSLSTGARRILGSGSGKTLALGTWSPDGRFLLALLEELLHRSLVAVECATDRHTEVMTEALEGGFTGVWAKRELLQQLAP